MYSVYYKSTSGDICLMQRDLTEEEAAALVDTWYKQTGLSAFIVCSD